MPRKTDKGWLVDMRPDGRAGRRVRKSFDTKAEALRFEAHVKGQAVKGEWNPKPADNRRLSELVELWYQAHGQHLKAHKPRKAALLSLAEDLKNPAGRLLKPADFTGYRSRRIADGISAKTCNNVLGYINAVFNELERTGEIDYPNPLKSVRPIKLVEKELAWLTGEQITALLDAVDADHNPHLNHIVRVCLATGARWGEAEGLNARTVRAGQVHFTDTKSGRNRSIPLPPLLFHDLERHMKQHGRFPQSYKAFRRALAASGLELPDGQASHVLRHTFASHFMMNNGNILTLQKILGHQSITMTMRYAHLSPDHLQDAATLNPLVNVD